ncbi:MAG TPA: hypothetical protein DCS82_02075, partial [Rhodospirillaceae bacterium]|nr:hypothetical protein [Rhodospirillaceae bacterium]
MTDYKLAEGWLEAGEAAASISGTQLLFVCGAVKSGTTWVQHWLNENPEIDCRGEAHLFTDFADGLVKLCDTQNRRIEGLNQLKRDGIPHFPTISSGLAQRLMRETVIGCLAAYDVGPEIKVLGEKTPTSSVAVGMILSLFPDAKILNVIRDGRDMVVSTWHHNLRSNREGFLKTFPTFDDFLPEIARIWVGHQTPLLELGENTAVRRIHYEDLLADPAPVVFGVFDWLDVAADEETVA